MTTPEQDKAAKAAAAEARESTLKALQAEREGYERRGLDDRVKQVDESIKALKGSPSGRSAPRGSQA